MIDIFYEVLNFHLLFLDSTGREAVDFQQSNCKKWSIRPLDPSHQRPKSIGRRNLKCLHDNTFWPRRWTLKESLGRMGIETQTMAGRPSFFLLIKIQSLTRSWPLDWKGCFGQGIKWDAPSSFELWAYFHDGRPSREPVGVHGQRFGL